MSIVYKFINFKATYSCLELKFVRFYAFLRHFEGFLPSFESYRINVDQCGSFQINYSHASFSTRASRSAPVARVYSSVVSVLSCPMSWAISRKRHLGFSGSISNSQCSFQQVKINFSGIFNYTQLFTGRGKPSAATNQQSVSLIYRIKVGPWRNWCCSYFICGKRNDT